MKPAKFSPDVISQELDRSEAIGDDGSVLMAMVKMWNNGRIGLLWTPIIFNTATPLPDDLRRSLIEMLRFHADRLEDRSLDARMKKLDPNPGGSA